MEEVIRCAWCGKEFIKERTAMNNMVGRYERIRKVEWGGREW